MIIIGAGMAGCLAGVLNPNAQIFESSESLIVNHDAVLRFRSDAIAKQIGIPFKQVTVHKGIFYDNEFEAPNIEIANMYSRKVTGGLFDRSIWNMAPSTRFIAPSNFHEILYEMCSTRVFHSVKFDSISKFEDYVKIDEPVISTIPMPSIINALEIQTHFEFKFKHIVVNRYKVANSKVHQTIYYPEYGIEVYRATLTGEDLIIESVHDLSEDSLDYALKSFAINRSDIEAVKVNWTQKYGKIQEIDDTARKNIMFNLTQQHGIYSLGRFATWRNILLDDVLLDIYKIREMITMSNYDIKKLCGE